MNLFYFSKFMTIIIDGKQIAEELKEDLKIKIDHIKNVYNIEPCLAVILVGENPASQIYVKNKKQTAESLGIKSISIILSENIDQNELLQTIKNLNQDGKVHGILLQLPLPKHLNSFEALMTIDSKKDVDGFHPINVGLLSIGKPHFISCTPKGCMKLIHSVKKDLSGLNAVVIGRSNIVGLPVANLLLQGNCTVQITHSKTQNLKELVLNADIIVAATGKMHLITEDMISPTKNPIIVDVGINRYFDEIEQKNKITGDVNFHSIIQSEKAFAITPVPGGVGPMTIACLLENLIFAVENSLNSK
jgi:methylenetetrahydrofolate dehydrogenase (NADP+)/methenyltetrahydrofolate cyclohydrolase